MTKLFWRALKSLPAMAIGSVAMANVAVAQNVDESLSQINYYQRSGSS